MLELLQGKASGGKLRLFAAARCRLFRPDWAEDLWPIREAVDAAEQSSDGLCPAEQLTRLHRPPEVFREEVRFGTMDPTMGSTVLPPSYLGQLLVQAISSPDASTAAWGVLYDDLWPSFGGYWKGGPQERRAESQLLREVFGNPFRPVTILHTVFAWNDGTVAKLAQGIYDGRAFDGLPVLADALEAAGATDAALLGHLRGPGPHALGCWALDIVVGKS
jgi:hypothetical protein